MVKNILFFCAEVFPTNYGFLERVFNTILKEEGINFTWIMPSLEVDRVRVTRWNENSLILVPKITPRRFADLFRAYWRHLSNLKQACNLAVRRNGPYRAVQVRDDPLMAYVGWKTANSLKVPLIYQLSHLKEEEAVLYSRIGLYKGRLRYYAQGRFGRIIRNFLLNRADLIFPISQQMKETLVSYGVKKAKLVPLPEAVDVPHNVEMFDEEAKKLKTRLQLPSGKTLIYLGSMNRLRKLDFLLSVFKEVLKTHPTSKLLMVGQGREEEDLTLLMKLAKDMNIYGQVVFTGPVPRSEVPVYLRSSTIGISPIPPNVVYMNSSPIKILEYLAWGLPVVANDLPAQGEIISKTGAGFCIRYELDSFVQAIDKLLRLSDEERRELARCGSIYIQSFRTFDILAGRVLEAYQSLSIVS